MILNKLWKNKIRLMHLSPKTSSILQIKEEIFLSLMAGIVGGLVYGFVGGLVDGLVGGLVGGLVASLVASLVYCLVYGLVPSLVPSLMAGIVGGLVGGIIVILFNFHETFPFIVGLKPILLLILGIIIFTELLFLLDKSKPKNKENKFNFTLKRKAEAFFEVILGLSAVSIIYILLREINIVKYFPEIVKWIGYIGIEIIKMGLIGLIGYVWIKLNSLRYENRKS